MKRFGMRAAICVAAMTLGTVAHAETGVAIGWGVGSHSCGRFIAAIGNLPPGQYRPIDTGNVHFVSENTQYQQWLMGFLTGFNEARGGELEQQINGIDLAGLDLWMRNWCNQHPMETVFRGAMAFIKEMQTNGQR